MIINKILYIEDSTTKYMDVLQYLKKQGFSKIDWVTNAENAISKIEDAARQGEPYDLLISDMHFDFFGTDDHEAGEKTLNLIRKQGYDIPVIFCSSQNWKVPGSIGNIFYNPRKDWEFEADQLFRMIRT